MSAVDVFRPSNESIFLRNPLEIESHQSADNFKKCKSYRPATAPSGHRFGKLSYNQFFTRHNPHPTKVRHMKGLLDVPICSVIENGSQANCLYSLKFPPDMYNQNHILKYFPASAVNVNTHLKPINTISGLSMFDVQRDAEDLNDSWKMELTALIDAVKGVQTQKRIEQSQSISRGSTAATRASKYSAATGRLIPPPSRGISGSRRKSPNQNLIQENDELRTTVMQLLCQILQTSSIESVQSWLCTAGDEEKSLVMQMIQTFLGDQDRFKKQSNMNPIKYNYLNEKLPNGAKQENFDRLTIHEDSKEVDVTNTSKNEGEVMKLPDVFKPEKSACGIRSRKTPSPPKSAVIRYKHATEDKQESFDDIPSFEMMQE